MAEEGDNAQIQERLKGLEDQLQEVQKRTQDLAAPQTDAVEPPVEVRASAELKETSAFRQQKEPAPPAAKERATRATGRYDQDVGDFAESPSSSPSRSSNDSSARRQRGPDAPQQPYYGPGMMPPQMPPFYPMYPQYYPMPQMNYMPMGQPMPMMQPMMQQMPPQYQSYDGSQYWAQQRPQADPRQQRPPENARQSHHEDAQREDIESLKSHFEDLLKEKDEEIERLRQDLTDRPADAVPDLTLQRKLQATEDELAFSRREMELAREYIEKFKAQLDEKDRAMRHRIQELESDNKLLRERAEKMESALNSEKNKASAAVERLEQAEETMAGLQEKLMGTSKDLEEMKRTRLQYVQKYQGDLDSLKKEVKYLNNALEQANLQLDHARYDLQQTERRARHTSQEQANVEINRLTQQVQMLQRQLETTGENYARFAALQERKGREMDRRSLSPGRPERRDFDWGNAQKPLSYERPSPQRKPDPPAYDWSERQRPRTQPSRRAEMPARSPAQVLENQLVGLQMEKQVLEGEYLKLPDRARTMTARKRRDELEARLKAIDSGITTLKTQLRGFKVLHT